MVGALPPSVPPPMTLRGGAGSAIGASRPSKRPHTEAFRDDLYTALPMRDEADLPRDLYTMCGEPRLQHVDSLTVYVKDENRFVSEVEALLPICGRYWKLGKHAHAGLFKKEQMRPSHGQYSPEQGVTLVHLMGDETWVGDASMKGWFFVIGDVVKALARKSPSIVAWGEANMAEDITDDLLMLPPTKIHHPFWNRSASEHIHVVTSINFELFDRRELTARQREIEKKRLPGGGWCNRAKSLIIAINDDDWDKAKELADQYSTEGVMKDLVRPSRSSV